MKATPINAETLSAHRAAFAEADPTFVSQIRHLTGLHRSGQIDKHRFGRLWNNAWGHTLQRMTIAQQDSQKSKQIITATSHEQISHVRSSSGT